MRKKHVAVKTAMQFRAEDLKSLQEQRNEAVQAMKDMTATAEAEQRAFSDEETAQFDELEKKVQNFDASIQRMERARDLSLNVISQKKREQLSVEEMEERAFEAYLRSEILEERGSDVNLTKGDNGAVIPSTIANKIITKVHEISPIYEMATRYNVKGTLSIPYYPADASTDVTMAYATEFEDLDSTSGSFGSISLTGFLAGALTKVSKSLMNNSQFNIVDFVIKNMAETIARWVEGECIHGTSSPAQKVTGVIAGITQYVTAAGKTAVTADELIELQEKLPDVYQNGACWIMSRNTRTKIRQLKDGEGRYILNQDATSKWGYTLFGKPVYVSENMEDMAASKPAILYGDFSGLAVKLTEALEIQVLREKYATQHAVGVVAWMEFDAKVENAQKLAKLVMHAN